MPVPFQGSQGCSEEIAIYKRNYVLLEITFDFEKSNENGRWEVVRAKMRVNREIR
jgi:hypothetical protein